jgi:hypothetical protein
MNGSKAKALRRLSKHDVKTWRGIIPKDKYRIKEHTKILTRMQDGKPVKVKFVSLQLFTRGSRTLYQHYKRQYKRGTINV